MQGVNGHSVSAGVPGISMLFSLCLMLSGFVCAKDGWFQINRSVHKDSHLLLQKNPSDNKPSSKGMIGLMDDDMPAVQDSLLEQGASHSADTDVQALSDSTQSIVSDPVNAIADILEIESIDVDMFVGEIKVLGPVEVTRVAIGNGQIIKAEVLENGELLVIAEAEGSTSLRLWHTDNRQSDYNIRVGAIDPETRIRLEKMVHMRVKIVEFRRSALDKLGVDWSDTTAGPGMAVAGDLAGNIDFRPQSDAPFSQLPNTVKPFSTYFGIASNVSSRINLLASSGDATTLAEPVLSTVNGGSASFLAGGEVPYPTVAENGQSVVEFKEYGIKLTISPSIDAMNNVRTTVDTEISQLDPAVSVQGAPGLLTRRIKTLVNVRSGETIVLSGLLSSESSQDVDKVPGIGNLPIIGHFFKSSAERNSVSELVVFLTPIIVDPSSASLSQRHQQFLDHSNQTVQDIHKRLLLLD